MTLLKSFWIEEEGQDLIEYTLLLAFVCLVAAVVFIQAGTYAAGIWTQANSILKDANAKVTPS